ncbi:MAG: molybdopterin molybdotransferase MoeA [Desulfurococcales archaeon]|nr:molybdopterin molybdotransferase MoeA [Desulfurococcales archaeon]
MARYIEELTPIPEALKLLKRRVSRLSEWSQMPVWEGQGLVLARDVVMPHDHPPKPKSAYDGYAVRSVDTPGELEVVGEAPIGVTDTGLRVERGQAVYVTTGAYLPDGADAVVPEEYVERVGDKIRVGERYEKWANVDPPGVYVRKGDVVLREGTLLTAMDVVALLDVGVTTALFYRPLRVAIIETGNELFKPSDPEETRRKVLKGLVVATTGDLLAWFINEYLSWVEVVDLVTLPDNLETLVWYIGRLLDRVDVVLISGGTGPSEIDLFYRLPEALGGELVFRGLFVKGGRPTSAVVVDGKPVIGLSGYPLSALHGFIRLVYPLLAYMANLRVPPPIPFYWAELTRPLSIKRPRPIKVKLGVGEGGTLTATPLERKMQHSSATIALTMADGLALTEKGEYSPGDRVLVLAYRLPPGFHEPSINF